MADIDKVIAWLADTELFYREHAHSSDDLYNIKMACDALELLKEQQQIMETQRDIIRIQEEQIADLQNEIMI